ncbi:hypothetical protein FKM82_003565 [Ascaphus truei]
MQGREGTPNRCRTERGPPTGAWQRGESRQMQNIEGTPERCRTEWIPERCRTEGTPKAAGQRGDPREMEDREGTGSRTYNNFSPFPARGNRNTLQGSWQGKGWLICPVGRSRGYTDLMIRYTKVTRTKKIQIYKNLYTLLGNAQKCVRVSQRATAKYYKWDQFFTFYFPPPIKRTGASAFRLPCPKTERRHRPQ